VLKGEREIGKLFRQSKATTDDHYGHYWKT